MVDVLGHFAIALLFAIPAWLFWDGRAALIFIGLVTGTAMLPDVDLVLQGVTPIEHHGVTHTVLFVTIVSLLAGAIVEGSLKDWLERQYVEGEGHALTTGALFVFVTGAFLLGGYSHLFADMLSAPDIAAPVEPFWPFFEKPWSVDLVWYNAPWVNSGLFVAALGLHLLLAFVDFGVDHRYRMRGARTEQS